MPDADLARPTLPLDIDQIAVAPGASCGALLAAARVARDMKRADIAALTRFSEAYIAAIEEGNYTEFAAPIYLRGAVRGYARAVGLDADMLIGLLHREIAVRGLDWRRSGGLS